MPSRICATPKCPEPATYRGRCQKHARQREQQTHSDRRIYKTKRWRILRRHRLTENPLCPCGAIATDVDHILPIASGGLPFSYENTRSFCHSCHSRATRNYQRTGVNEPY